MDYKWIMAKADDKIMSMAELMEDDTFKKIPEDKIGYYIEEPIKIGKKTAEEVRNKYNNLSIEEICHEMDVKIEREKDEYDFEIVKLKGKYDADKKKITMYPRSIKKMESAYDNLNIKFLNYDFLYEILLTHELFHHIEAGELGSISDKLEKVDVFKFIHIKKQYPIFKTSDIGANAFTKHMLNLSFNPKVLNYLYLLGTGYTEEERIISYFNELNESIYR